MKPRMAPATPTTVPFAATTSRTWRSVAPIDSSIPIERIRRCASTVKPPIETRAIKSMPRTSAASEMVSGFNGLDAATEAGVLIGATLLSVRTALGGTRKSTVTCDGWET